MAGAVKHIEYLKCWAEADGEVMSRKMTISEIAKQAYSITQQQSQQRREFEAEQRKRYHAVLDDQALDIVLESPLAEWFGKTGWEFVWRNTDDLGGGVSVIVKRKDIDDEEWRFMVSRYTYANADKPQWGIHIVEKAEDRRNQFGSSGHVQKGEVRDAAGVGAYLHTREQERHMVAVPQDSD